MTRNPNILISSFISHNPDFMPISGCYMFKQYGGPDGEISASLRYLSQRYSMPYREVMGILTDIGVSVPKLRIIDFKFAPEKRNFRSFIIF